MKYRIKKDIQDIKVKDNGCFTNRNGSLIYTGESDNWNHNNNMALAEYLFEHHFSEYFEEVKEVKDYTLPNLPEWTIDNQTDINLKVDIIEKDNGDREICIKEEVKEEYVYGIKHYQNKEKNIHELHYNLEDVMKIKIDIPKNATSAYIEDGLLKIQMPLNGNIEVVHD